MYLQKWEIKSKWSEYKHVDEQPSYCFWWVTTKKKKKTKYSNIRRHLLIRSHVNNLRQLDRCGGITWLDIQEQPFTSLLLPSFSSLYIGCLALIAFSSRMSSLGLPILSDFSWFTYCVARNFSSLFAVSPLN